MLCELMPSSFRIASMVGSVSELSRCSSSESNSVSPLLVPSTRRLARRRGVACIRVAVSGRYVVTCRHSLCILFSFFWRCFSRSSSAVPYCVSGSTRSGSRLCGSSAAVCPAGRPSSLAVTITGNRTRRTSPVEPYRDAIATDCLCDLAALANSSVLSDGPGFRTDLRKARQPSAPAQLTANTSVSPATHCRCTCPGSGLQRAGCASVLLDLTGSRSSLTTPADFVGEENPDCISTCNGAWKYANQTNASGESQIDLSDSETLVVHSRKTVSCLPCVGSRNVAASAAQCSLNTPYV